MSAQRTGYDLRHSNVSWLLQAGLDMYKLQKHLGHKSITTTLDRYSHLLPEGFRDTTAAMERAFEAVSGEDRGRRAVWPWASSCLGRLVKLFRPPDRFVGNAVTQWA